MHSSASTLTPSANLLLGTLVNFGNLTGRLIRLYTFVGRCLENLNFKSTPGKIYSGAVQTEIGQTPLKLPLEMLLI